MSVFFLGNMSVFLKKLICDYVHKFFFRIAESKIQNE